MSDFYLIETERESGGFVYEVTTAPFRYFNKEGINVYLLSRPPGVEAIPLCKKVSLGAEKDYVKTETHYMAPLVLQDKTVIAHIGIIKKEA